MSESTPQHIENQTHTSNDRQLGHETVHITVSTEGDHGSQPIEVTHALLDHSESISFGEEIEEEEEEA